MSSQSSRTIIGSSVAPFRLVFIMWLVFTIDLLYGFDLKWLGLLPRTVEGLTGILFAPILHGDLQHLISNTVPTLFLGGALYFSYRRIASKVFVGCYLGTGILVWIFARPSYHIGASGLVYALAAFLIAFGLFRRDFASLFIAAIVLFVYGSIFYGVLPSAPNISWESHLFGAIIGVFWAYTFKNSSL
ncbi:MAG: rhomboid family intramembrane serine protease [Bacteroidota bacterium]